MSDNRPPDDQQLPPPPPAGADAAGWGATTGSTWDQQPGSSAGPSWQQPSDPGQGWDSQPAWQQPGYPPQQPQTNGLAVAALVCGIIALLLSWIPLINFLSIILGVAAVITGIMGIRRANDPRYGQRGLAIGGLATGGVALVVAIAMLAFVVSVFGDPEVRDGLFEEFERELERQEQLQEG
jgi:hypothetical protein